ncbi:MAG: glucose-6-phosphate isomerase [Helicobacteraceae bacterium]|jgi:glucose-6-phosphate isomerase|nr:glucose-6-phosphate isomerase [Helicobacteraceae bacterium]
MISAALHFKQSDAAGLKADQEALKKEWQSGASGYYALPDSQSAMLGDIETFSKKTAGFDTIIVVGIGGSSLGAKAADRLLRHLPQRNAKNLIFLENGDPLDLSMAIETINLHRSFILIISKSGGTIETISIFKLLLSKLGKSEADNSCAEQFAFITDKGSPLDALAQNNLISRFHLPKSVGGRFSVLSVVGLLPLRLAGYNAEKLLDGAKAVRDDFFKDDPLGISAKADFIAKSGKAINALFAYSNSFEEFVKWYVQLWGESLGKLNRKKERVGFTPVGLIGSVDQHSFLQLIMEGPLDKTVTFIKLLDFKRTISVPAISFKGLEKNDFINNKPFDILINSQADATLEALKSADIPCDMITVDKLSESNVGGLFFYFELLTSLVGVKLGVNTYDQPGVELGKQILEKKFKLG